MKIKLITTLLFLISCNLYSQTYQSIDFITGLEISDRILSLEDPEGIPIELINFRQENEIPKFNWRLGGNFNQRINKSYIFKTGLRLSSIGFKYKGITTLAFPGGPSSNLTEIHFKQDFLFFEFPLAVRKEFSNGKWIPFIEAGILPSIYLVSKATSVSDVERRVLYDTGINNQAFNKFQLAGFISFGLNYSLNEEVQLFCQPAFRYHFTNLYDANWKVRLFNYGLELGVRQVISTLTPVTE